MLTQEEVWFRRQLKPRIDWLAEGDANTSFFHAHARYRRRKNFIAKIKDKDNIVTSQGDKEVVVWNFYNALLGTPQERQETLNLNYFYQPPHELSELDAPHF